MLINYKHLVIKLTFLIDDSHNNLFDGLKEKQDKRTENIRSDAGF